MQTRTLFSPADGHEYAISRYTTIVEVELAVGERMASQRFAEERLYVFTDGRGMMDIYPGDQYEIRQTTALWTTPMLATEIWNTGPRPLHFAIFRVTGVPIPEFHPAPGAPDGLLTWTTVESSGHAAPGSGQNTVYLYEGHRHDEGLHLQIRLIPLRRSQRTHDPAEMLTLLPGGATQLHTHPTSKSRSTCYPAPAPPNGTTRRSPSAPATPSATHPTSSARSPMQGMERWCTCVMRWGWGDG